MDSEDIVLVSFRARWSLMMLGKVLVWQAWENNQNKYMRLSLIYLFDGLAE
jgi:hypothetical protein